MASGQTDRFRVRSLFVTPVPADVTMGSRQPRPGSLRRRTKRQGYALVLPPLIVLVAVIGIPTVDAFILSFGDSSLLGGSTQFIGLKNYTYLLGDGQFWQIVRTTVVWTVSNLGAQMVLGTAMAVFLNSRRRIDKVLRSVAVIPWVVPSVVAAAVWTFLYDPTTGLFDKVLLHLHLISQPIVWLGQIGTALPSVVAESVWKGTPFVMVIMLAALQAVPTELSEAALLDGASRAQRFTHVTLPCIRKTAALAAILTIAYSVNNFNAIWLMTKGGPLESTQILFTWGYDLAFTQFYTGLAAALSVILFVVLVVIAVIYFLMLERRELE